MKNKKMMKKDKQQKKAGVIMGIEDIEKIKKVMLIFDEVDCADFSNWRLNQKKINKAYNILDKLVNIKTKNNTITEFEKEYCSNCKFNNKENYDMCEITRSSLDNHLYCKNHTKI